MKFGVTLALCAFLFGFGLGGLFGAAENGIKAGLSETAAQVKDEIYGENDKKIEETIQKSWSYYKRAHMHAGGMGAAALSMMLLLAAFPAGEKLRFTASSLLGFGSIAYPLFWLLAARKAPALGGTDAAKEALSWLAIPAAGSFLAGTFLVAFAFVLFAFKPEEAL